MYTAYERMIVINDLFVIINCEAFINFTFVLISIRVDFDKLYHTISKKEANAQFIK